MRKLLLFSVSLCFIFFFISCDTKSGKTSENDSTKRDTNLYDITRPTGDNFLEDLLTIKDEAELKQKFGKENVVYDTVWGPENSFEFGSYLYRGTENEVIFSWNDSLHHAQVSTVSIEAKEAPEGQGPIYNNKWSSKTGIKLGMPLSELEKINEKPFEFSGFEWDYGGWVTNWNGGKLDNNVKLVSDGTTVNKAGFSVLLSEGASMNNLSEKEMGQVMGDQSVMSDNAVARKMQPRVERVSVYPIQAYKRGDGLEH
jgi:hypothetical protein